MFLIIIPALVIDNKQHYSMLLICKGKLTCLIYLRQLAFLNISTSTGPMHKIATNILITKNILYDSFFLSKIVFFLLSRSYQIQQPDRLSCHRLTLGKTIFSTTKFHERTKHINSHFPTGFLLFTTLLVNGHIDIRGVFVFFGTLCCCTTGHHVVFLLIFRTLAGVDNPFNWEQEAHVYVGIT
ncbi:hypothetical protein ACJX0J_010849 [Zea mays]